MRLVYRLAVAVGAIGPLSLAIQSGLALAAQRSTQSVAVQGRDPQALRARQLALVNARYLAYICFAMPTFDMGGPDPMTTDWGTGKAAVGSWNPTGLDARQWAREVKAAGMSGAILTTKHHDGFALWDSKARVTWAVPGETVGQETGYDTGGAGRAHPGNPYAGKDVVRDFVDAMRAEHLKVGLYFSILDFHMDITNGNVSAQKREFVKAQLTELLTNYGPVDYINLDGYVNTPPQVSGEDVPFGELLALVRKYQPNAIVLNHNYMGNYATTEAPFADTGGWYVLDVFPKGYDEPRAASDSIYPKWFYWPGSKLKEGREADFASKLNLLNESNGTLVLNIPPNREGRIPDEAIAYLARIKARWINPAPLAAARPGWGYSYDVTKNLAWRRPATQSSEWPPKPRHMDYAAPWGWSIGYPANIAVDGMTDGDNRLRRVAMTNPGVNNWWQVDLETAHRIDAITIHNRTDCCANRLSNYRVEVLDGSERRVWSQVRKLPPLPSTTLAVGGVRGSKVRITLLGNEQLQLAEVIVTGK